MNGKLNSDKIWTIWKKNKLNSEMIWKLCKESKLISPQNSSPARFPLKNV